MSWFDQNSGLIIFFSAVMCSVFLYTIFFKKGSRGNVPSFAEVKDASKNISENSKQTLEKIISIHKPNLSRESTTILCIATSLSIEQPIERLCERVILSEYLDSLCKIEFIMLVEKMFEIEIPDTDSHHFITFIETLRYVESRATQS
jgi:acyl carrier protein